MKSSLKKILSALGLLDFTRLSLTYLRSIRFATTNIAYYLQGAPDGLAIPPLGYVALVTGKPDIDLYFKTGRASAESIREVLAENGLKMEDFRSILDFGCGCGRVIRYWQKLGRTRICGVDYNKKLIRWCREHLGFGEFQINGSLPPLNFDNESFDFIYALSVFTHFTEEFQNAWMKELLRVLQSNGLLLFTTHGDYYLDQLTDTQKMIFQSGRLVVKEDGPVGSNLFGAYHPRTYVLDKLTSGMKLLSFVPQGAKGNPFQDVYLFRKV